jgi:PAS domain S-box-containing protein
VVFPAEANHQLLVKSAPLGIALISNTGRYRYLNPKFVDMFGYTLDDIPTGQEWFTRAFPDTTYRHQVISDWKLYLKECQAGEAEPRTFTVTCKDTSAKVIRFRAVPLEDGDQFLLYEDITALQQAEEARRETEELFRVLYECAADAFFVHDHGKILAVNQQACNSLGYSREELLGMKVTDFEVGLSPEELAALWQQPFIPPSTVFGVQKRKDGSTFPVEVRASSFDHEGRKLRFSLARDITDRLQAEAALRESELKYRTLVEQVPTITFIAALDDFSQTMYISPQVEAILGFSPADFEANPNLWAEQLHPEDSDRVLAAVARCHQTGDLYDDEYRMLARDGRTVWFRDKAQVVRDDSGRPLLLQGVMLDITERKQYEAKLLQAKEEWERTFDAISDLVMILDREYRIVRVNRSMAHRFGYEPEELEGKFCYQVVHDLEAPPASCPCRAVWSNGQPVQLDIWDEKLQGHFLLTTSPIYDLSGRIVGSVQVGTDITERKLAEEALQKSEARYRLLVEQIPAVIFKGYADWSIDCFDDKIERLTGYSKEDFNSRRLTWRDLIPAEELPYVKRVFQDALESDGSYFREHRIKKKGGDCAWVQCRGRIFMDDKGVVDYINGVTYDITARKEAEAALRESEERYRLMAENVRDLIWTTDLDLRFTYVSPSIRHVLGFTPEEIIGKSIGEFLPPASLSQALEVLSNELAQEELGLSDPNRHRVLELEEIHKEGATIQTEVKATFIRDGDGQPRAILGVTRDVTQRKEAEAAAERRGAILEAVSYAAEKFLQSRAWQEDIQEILGRLGKAVGVCRVYIFENHSDKNGNLLASRRHEWVAPNIAPQIDDPEFQGQPYKDGFGRWAEILGQGRIIWGHVKALAPAEQKILAAQGVKSLAMVPIFVGQQWWGGIGFNDCLQERAWSSVEIDALLVAAGLFGLAILSQQEEKALRNSEEKLRSLSYQLLTAQEQERRRLATELHNVLGHDLLLIKLKLESLQHEVAPEQMTQREEVSQILQALQDAVKNVRRLCQDLGPGDLEDLGLTRALQSLVENFAEAQKLTCQTELGNLDAFFEIPVQTAIYRLVQEALTNIGKHARAKHLWVRAQRDGTEVAFVIEDDGQGFDVAKALENPKTLGLLAMEEWVQILGGAFNIESQKQTGTKISFTIPVSAKESLK